MRLLPNPHPNSRSTPSTLVGLLGWTIVSGPGMVAERADFGYARGPQASYVDPRREPPDKHMTEDRGPTRKNPPDRRAFIRAGAAIGGTAWIAPVVLSITLDDLAQPLAGTVGPTTAVLGAATPWGAGQVAVY